MPSVNVLQAKAVLANSAHPTLSLLLLWHEQHTGILNIAEDVHVAGSGLNTAGTLAAAQALVSSSQLPEGDLSHDSGLSDW